jgi:predicted dehydrogenase/aryl-alcohol dehydrogenase-like predicted oxidoreductase
MADSLNWGIIGCGNIAKKFASGVAASKTGRLLACASRSKEKAEGFAAEYGAERAYGSYEELLADGEVGAVYVATPHPWHPAWTIRAAEAGKHVLCEKPLAINHGEAMQAVEAAARCDVFLMEAFMYRCHPQTARVVELVREGAIGEVRVIRAAFGFHAGFNPEGRLFKNALGGGGILDVGCYPVSLARLVAGAAAGEPFAEPEEVEAVGQLTETGVDAWTAAVLRFPGGIVAQVSTSVQVQLTNDAAIFGSEGRIHVPQPWQPGRFGPPKIIVHRKGADGPEEIETESGDLYGIEADCVAANLERRQAASPAMSWGDTLGNMQVLDSWRAAIGQAFDAEKPENSRPVRGAKLAVRPGCRMKYGELPGVGKKISRLVMGVDNQKHWPHAAAMFDDYFERGGNCFDSAWIYGRGLLEKNLGAWMGARGVREEVVILDKGCHTPENRPERFMPQLTESLERLGTDYVDIYMLHRDNEEVPVGEWVDALNEGVSSGKVRALGASNWSLERVAAANAYARDRNLVGFSAVSNNYSLAEMVDPPWKGCVSAKGSEDWFRTSGIALMPWSSQARGFFTGRARRDDRSDPELVRCWYSDENFGRLERVEEMAKKRQVTGVTVALAWVLCQDFPTFPLIGPRLISETRTSFDALELQLTPDQVAWLDLRG